MGRRKLVQSLATAANRVAVSGGVPASRAVAAPNSSARSQQLQPLESGSGHGSPTALRHARRLHTRQGVPQGIAAGQSERGQRCEQQEHTPGNRARMGMGPMAGGAAWMLRGPLNALLHSSAQKERAEAVFAEALHEDATVLAEAAAGEGQGLAAVPKLAALKVPGTGSAAAGTEPAVSEVLAAAEAPAEAASGQAAAELPLEAGPDTPPAAERLPEASSEQALRGAASASETASDAGSVVSVEDSAAAAIDSSHESAAELGSASAEAAAIQAEPLVADQVAAEEVLASDAIIADPAEDLSHAVAAESATLEPVEPVARDAAQAGSQEAVAEAYQSSVPAGELAETTATSSGSGSVGGQVADQPAGPGGKRTGRASLAVELARQNAGYKLKESAGQVAWDLSLDQPAAPEASSIEQARGQLSGQLAPEQVKVAVEQMVVGEAGAEVAEPAVPAGPASSRLNPNSQPFYPKGFSPAVSPAVSLEDEAGPVPLYVFDGTRSSVMAPPTPPTPFPEEGAFSARAVELGREARAVEQATLAASKAAEDANRDDRKLTAEIKHNATWQRLQALIASRSPESFNNIHISALWARLLQIYKTCSGQNKHAINTSGLLPALVALSTIRAKDLAPGTLAGIVSHLSALHPKLLQSEETAELVKDFLDFARQRAAEFEQRELSTILLGLSNMRWAPGEGPPRELMETLVEECRAKIDTFTDKGCTFLMLAFAKLDMGGLLDPAFIRELTEHLRTGTMSELPPWQLSEALWAMGLLGYEDIIDDGLMTKVAEAIAPNLHELHLANLSRIFETMTKIGFEPSQDVLVRIANRLATERSHQPTEYTAALRVFAHFGYKPEPQVLGRILGATLPGDLTLTRLWRIVDTIEPLVALGIDPGSEWCSSVETMFKQLLETKPWAASHKGIPSALASLGALGYRPREEVLQTLSSKLDVHQATPGYLSAVLSAFAALGHLPGDEALGKLVTQMHSRLKDFQPDQVKLICKSLETLGYSIPDAEQRDAVLAYSELS